MECSFPQKREAKRNGLCDADYAPLLPVEPPEGLVEWLRKKGFLKRELLIYKTDWYREPLSGERTQAVKLTCTACHGTMYANKMPRETRCGGPSFGFLHPETMETLGDGGHCLCPMCGAEAEIRHVGNMGQWNCVEAYPMTVHRLPSPTGGRDRLALCGWCVRKWFEKDGRSGITAWPYEAYVVEEKRLIRLNAYYKFMSNLSLSGKWQQRAKFTDVWGTAELAYPWRASLLAGTTAENSKLDLFWRAGNKGKRFSARPVTYLKLWQKHPNLENLVMQGAGKLVAELIADELENRRYCSPKPKGLPDLGIHWKERRPAQMLGLNKDEFRRLLEEEWDADALHYFLARKDSGRVLDREELRLCVELGTGHCRTLENGGQEPVFVARYLLRQKKKDKRCDMSILEDYWRMAAQRGYDLNNLDLRYPPNLYRAHERVQDEQRREREEKSRQEKAARTAAFRKRYRELSGFSWEKDGILIRPAKSEAELMREGAKLHHCVGTYAASVAKGSTAIFFLRRAEAPDEPWYTLELNEKELKVRQNRGSRNCARTQEVEAFEVAWIKHLEELRDKPRKKKKKEAHAA